MNDETPPASLGLPPLPPTDEPAAAPAPATPAVASATGGLWDAPSTDAQIDAAEFSKLDPRALTLGLISGAISWLFFAVPISIGVLVASLASWSSSGLLVFALGIGVLLLLAGTMIGMQIPRFRMYRYRADERGLEIHRGVLWRSRIFIPRSRIQHTDVNQGPIERQLGLARLVVHTAGTVRASTAISGLAHPVALAIRAALSHDVQDTDGV